jgi:hypothetical protein
MTPFQAFAQVKSRLARAPLNSPVTYIPYSSPGAPQTLYVEIDIKETIKAQGTMIGSETVLMANLNIQQGSYQLRDLFQFANPATGIVSEWCVVGAPVSRLDGSMDLMVEHVRIVETSGEGYRAAQ